MTERKRRFMSKLEKLYEDFNNEKSEYKKNQLGNKLVMQHRKQFGIPKDLEEE